MAIARFALVALIATICARAVAAQERADSTSTPPQRRATYVYPVPSSDQLTGFKLTVIAAYIWRTSLDGTTRPSALFTRLAYTEHRQQVVSFGADLWSPLNVRHWMLSVDYAKFPAPYFGIGSRTPESASELYNPRSLGASATVQQLVRRHLYAQVGFRVMHTSVEAPAPGSLLARDTPPGTNGYTNVAPEFGVTLDSRDHLYNPRTGEFIQLLVRVNVAPLGGSPAYQTGLLDARIYRTVMRGSVLALQVGVAGATGTVPFEELPQLGGSVVRAYVYGRWRDRTAVWSQAEWRQHLFWRVGAVAFTGAGVIGPDMAALGTAPVRTAYGAGLRFMLSRKERVNFSVDYARGQQGANALSVGFAEAF